MAKTDEPNQTPAERFADEAASGDPGLVREFALFLRYNKKWWLAPIVLTQLVLGAIVILGGTSAAPFIYPLL